MLPEHVWLPRARRHAETVDRWTAGHRARAASRTPHPVEDFLFTYYSHPPSRLRRWHPGVGVALDGGAAEERRSWRWHTDVGGGVGLDAAAFLADRAATVGFVRELLAATSSRPVHLGCFGMHEWAMVYRQAPDAVRHAQVPLRLGTTGTDEVVERQQIRCTHHDAFRFFTSDARPHNVLQPRREDQVALEQPGCLHATMDLYKWSYLLLPATPGELVSDCFALARDVRVLDMRASPYDLSDLGYEPVRVELPEGRAEYTAQQKWFAARGQDLRLRLLEVCDALLA